MKRNFLQIKKSMACIMAGLLFVLCANAQIGYQISLLNTATGEPRANETVNVTATITDSSGGVVWTGTQSVTSNDFGVLSLTVGNADTFTNFDLQQHRLPFFIEVSANGAMIGKSQILSVPVAEVAKRVEPGIKLEDIVGKRWQFSWSKDDINNFYVIFNSDYSVTIEYELNRGIVHYDYYSFLIDGNNILVYGYHETDHKFLNNLLIFRIINGQIYHLMV